MVSDKIKLSKFAYKDFKFPIDWQIESLNKATSKKHSRIIIGSSNLNNSSLIFSKIFNKLSKNNFRCTLVQALELRYSNYDTIFRELKEFDYVFINCVPTNYKALYNIRKLINETSIGFVISYLPITNRYKDLVEELTPIIFSNSILNYKEADCYLYQRTKRL